MTRTETFSKIKTPEVVKAFHQARDRARQHGWLLQTRLNLDHAAARMIVIETFAPGCEPRWRPMPGRIDTS